MTLLLTFLTSFLSGGATGLLGNAIKSGFDYFNRKAEITKELRVMELQHSNAKEMMELDIRKAGMVIEGNIREVQAEADGKEAVAIQERILGEAEVDAELRAAALEADKASYFGMSRQAKSAFGTLVDGIVSLLFGVVDAIRGLTRPVLTFTLVAMTFSLYKLLEKLGLSALTPTEVATLWQTIVGGTIYLTTTAVVFWFGSRPSSNSPKDK